jgi:B12-binding domain/radical SAM domain protein
VIPAGARPGTPELILHYRRTSRSALNVLAGAVTVHPATRAVAVRAAGSPAELAAAVGDALAAGRRPVVAWSFYTASFHDAAEELAAVRRGAPVGALHVAGGAHASAAPSSVLEAGFDLAALGEGEETLPALLAAVAAGTDPRRVPGLAWLEAAALRSSGRAPPVDLDAVPALCERLDRINPIEITRGCAWGCRFCQTPYLFKARWRHRSIAAVRAAVRYMRQSGARDLRFVTPSALSYGASGSEPNLDAVEALLAGVREEAGAGMRVFLGSFPSELRPEHVSPRALAILRRHCDNRTVILGAQSGSDRILAGAGRGHDARAIERAVALTVESGLEPWVDYVFGFPGEEEEDRAATRAQLARVAAMGARVHAHAFMPLPGTPWQDAEPGAVDGETELLLERLASAGRAHGPWRRQREIAARAPDGAHRPPWNPKGPPHRAPKPRS